MRRVASTRTTERPVRRRSRFGYDHRWWGERETPPAEAPPSYWELTRRPLPCLVFVLPLLAAYEAGVLWLGGTSPTAARAGADAWIRHGLAGAGLTDQWLLPLGLVAGLLAWQAADNRPWRFPTGALPAMLAESVVLAFGLIGLGELVDLGFERLEGAPRLLDFSPQAAELLTFLGAGIYEEALFRLAMIPLAYGLLKLLQTPGVLAGTLAITGSSLLFSLAHHAGAPGEPFTWFAFIFRWLAGIYFAAVFVARGFGVAVGAHAAYDVLVGWCGVHW